MIAFFSGAPGPLEILLILVVILLLFGAKRLPDLARSLGKSLTEFKKGKEEGKKELEDSASASSSEEESEEKPSDR
jgi:sec-independent protein translocase protein TatA